MSAAVPPMFTPFRIGSLELANRVVVSPMCQYSAEEGMPADWHLVHLGSRALGGAGLIFTEATATEPSGRITPGCCGIWSDAQRDAWRRIVEFVHRHSPARLGLQLAHAGRKAGKSAPWQGDRPIAGLGWDIVGPSPIPFDAGHPTPREVTRADMTRLRGLFVDGARRAAEAGFDLLEVHAAHGYLLSSFLSPLTNARTDEYGGSLENRLRFPLEVVDAVRAAWPAERPLAVRISACDWAPGGLPAEEAVEIARAMSAHGADLIDVSTGGTVAEARPEFAPMYQTPFAERIRRDAGVPTIAVGMITSPGQANAIVAEGRADLVAMGRMHLYDPYFTRHAARALGHELAWPPQYVTAGRITPGIA